MTIINGELLAILFNCAKWIPMLHVGETQTFSTYTNMPILGRFPAAFLCDTVLHSHQILARTTLLRYHIWCLMWGAIKKSNCFWVPWNPIGLLCKPIAGAFIGHIPPPNNFFPLLIPNPSQSSPKIERFPPKRGFWGDGLGGRGTGTVSPWSSLRGVTCSDLRLKDSLGVTDRHQSNPWQVQPNKFKNRHCWHRWSYRR